MTKSQASHAPSDDAPFLLLNVPDSSARRKDIVGAVLPTKNSASPFLDYAPQLEDSSLTPAEKTSLEAFPDRIWKNEKKETVALQDVLTGRSTAKSKQARAKITEFLATQARKAVGIDVKIEAGQARHFMINNAGGELRNNLMKNEAWKTQVLKLYNSLKDEERSFLMVVGVYMCSNFTVSWDMSEEKAYNSRLGIPADQILNAHGVPARGLNADFEFDADQSDKQKIFARCKDEIIFALSYVELELDVESVEQVKTFWDRTKALVTGGSTKKRTHAYEITNAYLGRPVRDRGVDPYAGDSDESEAVAIETDIFYTSQVPSKTVVEVQAAAAERTASEVPNGSDTINGTPA